MRHARPDVAWIFVKVLAPLLFILLLRLSWRAWRHLQKLR